MMVDLATELFNLLGTKGCLPGDQTGGHEPDWLDRYSARQLGVARPATTSEVSQVIEGAQLKDDIPVPLGRLGEFLAASAKCCERILPGKCVNPFGHLADENTHDNLSPPVGAQDFGASASLLAEVPGQVAGQIAGVFAAEHGLGRAMVALADRLRSPVERNLMSRIKQAFGHSLR